MSSPRVSVILPTYNRADTILRAIASVRAQTLEDWELVVVDDGSTDDTRAELAGVRDPRVRVIAQANQGVAGARNTGLAAARGALIGFVDSDDALEPHHLALASDFFAAHEDAHLYTSEFWEDFGRQRYVVHPRTEMSEWYPATARRLGARAFDAEPAHGDPYLWYYASREPIGAWGAALEGTPWREGAMHYRGDIFPMWRWGWLMAMQPTVITRRALEAVGPIDASYPVASDFGWLASLCRRFTTHFVSAPGAIKHEYAGDATRPLGEAHLVTGRTATQFHLDVLRFHEELFWNDHPGDPELAALRGFRQSLVAKAALGQGLRGLARANLEEAARTYPGRDTSALLWLSRVPQDRLATLFYKGSIAGARLGARVRRVVHRATHGGT